MTGDWQRAALMPSWVRWLPCSHAYLTAVPDQRRFRRSAWDSIVPWQQAAWCDPGDVEDWVERAKKRHPRNQAEHAEEHAREHYDRAVTLRASRIERFTEICRRQGIAAPHTLGELFQCMVDFGLFELEDSDDGDDPWVRPRLTKNPLDVLPFYDDERESERQAQANDWMVLTAIALRRKAESRFWPRQRQRSVRTTPRRLAMTVGKSAGIEVEEATIVRALRDLVNDESITVDGLSEQTDQVDQPDHVDQQIRVGLVWPEFRHAYPYDDLPAPEHGV